MQILAFFRYLSLTSFSLFSFHIFLHLLLISDTRSSWITFSSSLSVFLSHISPFNLFSFFLRLKGWNASILTFNVNLNLSRGCPGVFGLNSWVFRTCVEMYSSGHSCLAHKDESEYSVQQFRTLFCSHFTIEERKNYFKVWNWKL